MTAALSAAASTSLLLDHHRGPCDRLPDACAGVVPCLSDPATRGSLYVKVALVLFHVVVVGLLFLLDEALVEKTKREPWYIDEAIRSGSLTYQGSPVPWMVSNQSTSRENGRQHGYPEYNQGKNGIRQTTTTNFSMLMEDLYARRLNRMGAGRREIVEEFNSESDAEGEKIDELKRQLLEVPLGELQKARADGSHTFYRKPTCDKIFRRANKNRPSEVSNKLPVPRFREVVQVPKKVCRDPRFESLCGTLDQDGFRKRYNFLFEVELPAEKKKLQMMLKKSKDAKVIEELQNHISWMDKQLKSRPSKSKSVDAQILTEHKKKEREAVKQGKKPFYLKKSDIRKRRLIEKYNELKTTGKLESFIDKRRKKNASKDRRYMPYRRSGGIEQHQ